MPPKFHSGRAYVAFDESIRNLEAWVYARAPRFGEFDARDIARRLLQRIVEIGLNEFVLACARRLDAGEDPLPKPRSAYSCGGLVLAGAGSRIRVRAALFLRSIGLFLAHWTHALLIHVAALFRRRALARGPATLVYGVGAAELNHGGSDGEFLAFCRQGPIGPLRSARRLIVQSVKPIASSSQVGCTYHRVPLFALVLENPIGIVEFLQFLVNHMRALLRFAIAVVRLPVVCVLGRDFAYHATATRLNRQGMIENIIITNSNYSAQPLWMRQYPGRNYATHMVWYSQNSIPFVYAFDRIRTPLPNHRHFAFDATWVWTEGYADYIRSLGIGAMIHVVGPILWYLPKPPLREPNTKEIRVMVFDVTPVRPEVAKRIGLVYNYYSTENVVRFIDDIVTAARNVEPKLGKKVRVFLKHKRNHDPARDPRYIAAIERLAGTEAALELEPPEANIYALVSGSDLVIAVPYSSPVYVAKCSGVNAMFYDPTGELLAVHDAAADVQFSASPLELEKKMLQLLGDSARQSRNASDTGYPPTA